MSVSELGRLLRPSRSEWEFSRPWRPGFGRATFDVVDEPQAAAEPAGGLGVEGMIQAGEVVRIEVVADQRDHLGVGIILVQQTLPASTVPKPRYTTCA